MTILLLSILIMKFRRWKTERQLKWQQTLASTGIGFRTQVLAIREEGQRKEACKQLYIQTRLRVNGKIVKRWVYTLLNDEGKLQAGDRIHIRYNPYRLGQVVLCSKSV